MVIKIGTANIDNCGIGFVGDNVEVGEANVSRTGIAVWGADQSKARDTSTQREVHQTKAGNAVRATGRFMRDVSAATVAAVLAATIKPN